MRQKSLDEKTKRTPAIKRTPVAKERNIALKWKTMRESEQWRRKKARVFSRYKNKYLLDLISDAITKYYWTSWEKQRIRVLRKTLEDDYDIPINFFCTYVYFATYRYMSWKHRSLEYKNYIGFISNEYVLTDFANYVSSKSLSWRKRNSRWPSDFEERWGVKTSIKTQKLGRRDKIIDDDLMSEKMKKKINRFL